MLSPKVGVQILTFFVFEKKLFLHPFFVPRRFSLEVLSLLKIAFFAIFKKHIKPPSILLFFLKKKTVLGAEHPKLQWEAK